MEERWSYIVGRLVSAAKTMRCGVVAVSAVSACGATVIENVITKKRYQAQD